MKAAQVSAAVIKLLGHRCRGDAFPGRNKATSIATELRKSRRILYGSPGAHCLACKQKICSRIDRVRSLTRRVGGPRLSCLDQPRAASVADHLVLGLGRPRAQRNARSTCHCQHRAGTGRLRLGCPRRFAVWRGAWLVFERCPTSSSRSSKRFDQSLPLPGRR
jgi:hypothetical protein